VLLGEEERAAAVAARKSEFFVIVLAGASHRPLRAAVLFFLVWYFSSARACVRMRAVENGRAWEIFSISFLFSLLFIRFQMEMRVESVTGDRTRLPLGIFFLEEKLRSGFPSSPAWMPSSEP
jgi:hypothetical protein